MLIFKGDQSVDKTAHYPRFFFFNVETGGIFIYYSSGDSDAHEELNFSQKNCQTHTFTLTIL